MWDIYLYNEKETSSFENDLSIFNTGLGITKDGEVYLIRELLSNIQCPMDLRNFPHDTQHCEMQFISFNYELSEVNFTQEISCGDMESCDTASVIQSSVFKRVSIKGSTGTRLFKEYGTSYVSVKIVFQRQLSFYLYQVIFISFNSTFSYAY